MTNQSINEDVQWGIVILGIIALLLVLSGPFFIGPRSRTLLVVIWFIFVELFGALAVGLTAWKGGSEMDSWAQNFGYAAGGIAVGIGLIGCGVFLIGLPGKTKKNIKEEEEENGEEIKKEKPKYKKEELSPYFKDTSIEEDDEQGMNLWRMLEN